MNTNLASRLLCLCLLPSALGLETLRADCVSAPSGLIHWYRGESDATDFFGTGSPMQTNGALTFVAAKVGQGLQFDGSSGLVVPDSDTLDFDATQSFTIEAWVRIDGVFGNDSLLLDKRQPGGGLGYVVGLIGTNSESETRKFYCVVQGGVTFDVRTAPVADNAFHHLAVVLNRAANALALYFDGALQQTKNVSGLGSLQNNGRLFLGHQSLDVPGTTGIPLNGVLDELSIYNRALNSNEIAAIFNAGSTGKCPPLCVPVPSGAVAWWRAENSALDQVSTNHGTLLNGATFAAGLVGQAFSFDGNTGFIQVADSASLRPTTGVSLEVWMHTTGTADFSGIISKMQHGGAIHLGWKMGMDTAGRPRADFGNGSGIGNDYLSVSHPAVVTDGNWHHLVATYDGAVAFLYVDGTPGSPESGMGFLTANTRTLIIGNDDCTSSSILFIHTVSNLSS